MFKKYKDWAISIQVSLDIFIIWWYNKREKKVQRPLRKQVHPSGWKSPTSKDEDMVWTCMKVQEDLLNANLIED